ncbi:DUF4198 domain-containing protein [soil metagenome]
MIARATLTAALALAASLAHAHDFVLAPAISEGPGVTVTGRFGHPGSWLSIDPDRLSALDAHPPGAPEAVSILAAVEPSALKLVASSGDLDAGPGTWVVAATYDNGYWLKLDGGKYHNITKKEAPSGAAVTQSSRELKYSKALISKGGGQDGFDRAVGQRLEIVPTAMAADKVTVRVLFDGEPLSAAKVAGSSMMGGDQGTSTEQTGADGSVEIPLGKPGLQLLRVYHQSPPGDPDLSDKDNFSATLVFATE